MKKIGKLVLAGTLALVGLSGLAAEKGFVYPANASAPLPDWAFGPFVRPEGVNPVIAPRTDTEFPCPMRKRPLKWEESDTFNPAAAIKDGKIVVLYRAEDNTFKGIGRRTSRLGYAETTDGFTMKRDPAPVLFPQEDDQKQYDWEGGCEDPRIAQTEDGLYVCTYTSWNRKVARLCIATSRDLKHWKKHGPAFAKARNGAYLNRFCKSAAIVQAPSKTDPSRYVITKINGRYQMYWGENSVQLATSDNLIDWDPGVTVMHTRRGAFDSSLTEVGPAAILTPKGIVLFYNGKNNNGKGADPRFPRGVYCAGQALFSATEPTKFLARLDVPYFRPEAPFERTGQYKDGTVFTEGLVFYKGKWHLYYGCADSFVGYAVWDPAAKKGPVADAATYSHVHRGGGARERPDNTLETFIWSWEHGVGVECDCRMTGDGVAVMLHDGKLRRTGRNADAKLLNTPVAKLAYADFAQVDVGSYISPKFAGEHVPTLEAVLKEMAKRPRAQIFVDDKGVGPARLAEMAGRFGVLDRVWYTHCNLRNLQAWRKVVPDGKTRLWWGPGTNQFTPAARAAGEKRIEKKMNELRACNFDGVTLICLDTHYNPASEDPFLPSSAYLKKLADECHARGVILTLVPYGGGDQKEAYLKLRERTSCDGFCTDNPSALFDALRTLSIQPRQK